MSQEVLGGMPTAPHDGLFARVAHGGEIDHAAWLRIRSEGGFVGTCRLCHDHLIPQSPDEHAGRIDYEADCRNPECSYVMLAPGGRVMRHSTLRSHQPKGA
jgi:hypothetical protein